MPALALPGSAPSRARDGAARAMSGTANGCGGEAGRGSRLTPQAAHYRKPRGKLPAGRVRTTMHDQYPTLYRDFRWQVPKRLQHRRRSAAQRWARDARRTAILYEEASGATARCDLSRPARRRQPTRQRAAPRSACGAATGSRSCCRSARKPRSPTSRSTGSARSRCRCRSCSARTRWATASQDSAAVAAIVDADALADLRQARTDGLRHLIVVGRRRYARSLALHAGELD